jgi:hypothetical protein
MDGSKALRRPCRGAVILGCSPGAARGLPPATIHCPSGTRPGRWKDFVGYAGDKISRFSG